MKITKFDAYKDGGTIEIRTDEGDFFIDHRLGTTTDGEFFDQYPSNISAKKLTPSKETMDGIIKALEGYQDVFYIKMVSHLIETLKADA